MKVNRVMQSKLETQWDVRNSNSGNMSSSGENGLNVRTNASSKLDRINCLEE